MKNLSSIFIILILAGILNSCKSGSVEKQQKETFPEFFKVGHRGARGLMPENTIPSMKKAIDEGANFLEVDIQISKDNQVVVYHDPIINGNFTLLPDGNEIKEGDSQNYIIYQMNYEKIRDFKIGTKTPPGFSEQEKIDTHIPLLGELIDSVEAYTAEKNLPPVNYLIEIKANPEKDGVYQPAPETYIKLIMDVLEEKSIGNRFYLQSFDTRQLREIRKNHPDIILGFLTGNKNATFEENIDELGFFPDVYSPNFNLATDELIQKAHANNMKFVPWTVNSEEEMRRLINKGVNGIITDYPNLLQKIIEEQ